EASVERRLQAEVADTVLDVSENVGGERSLRVVAVGLARQLKSELPDRIDLVGVGREHATAEVAGPPRGELTGDRILVEVGEDALELGRDLRRPAHQWRAGVRHRLRG